MTLALMLHEHVVISFKEVQAEAEQLAGYPTKKITTIFWKNLVK